MRPHAEDRVARPRVVLGDDGDAHARQMMAGPSAAMAMRLPNL
jgi:hypothetical protein